MVYDKAYMLGVYKRLICMITLENSKDVVRCPWLANLCAKLASLAGHAQFKKLQAGKTTNAFVMRAVLGPVLARYCGKPEDKLEFDDLENFLSSMTKDLDECEKLEVLRRDLFKQYNWLIFMFGYLTCVGEKDEMDKQIDFTEARQKIKNVIRLYDNLRMLIKGESHCFDKFVDNEDPSWVAVLADIGKFQQVLQTDFDTSSEAHSPIRMLACLAIRLSLPSDNALRISADMYKGLEKQFFNLNMSRSQVWGDNEHKVFLKFLARVEKVYDKYFVKGNENMGFGLTLLTLPSEPVPVVVDGEKPSTSAGRGASGAEETAAAVAHIPDLPTSPVPPEHCQQTASENDVCMDEIFFDPEMELSKEYKSICADDAMDYYMASETEVKNLHVINNLSDESDCCEVMEPDSAERTVCSETVSVNMTVPQQQQPEVVEDRQNGPGPRSESFLKGESVPSSCTSSSSDTDSDRGSRRESSPTKRKTLTKKRSTPPPKSKESFSSGSSSSDSDSDSSCASDSDSSCASKKHKKSAKSRTPSPNKPHSKSPSPQKGKRVRSDSDSDSAAPNKKIHKYSMPSSSSSDSYSSSSDSDDDERMDKQEQTNDKQETDSETAPHCEESDIYGRSTDYNPTEKIVDELAGIRELCTQIKSDKTKDDQTELDNLRKERDDALTQRDLAYKERDQLRAELAAMRKDKDDQIMTQITELTTLMKKVPDREPSVVMGPPADVQQNTKSRTSSISSTECIPASVTLTEKQHSQFLKNVMDIVLKPLVGTDKDESVEFPEVDMTVIEPKLTKESPTNNKFYSDFKDIVEHKKFAKRHLVTLTPDEVKYFMTWLPQYSPRETTEEPLPADGVEASIARTAKYCLDHSMSERLCFITNKLIKAQQDDDKRLSPLEMCMLRTLDLLSRLCSGTNKKIGYMMQYKNKKHAADALREALGQKAMCVVCQSCKADVGYLEKRSKDQTVMVTKVCGSCINTRMDEVKNNVPEKARLLAISWGGISMTVPHANKLVNDSAKTKHQPEVAHKSRPSKSVIKRKKTETINKLGNFMVPPTPQRN